MANRVIANGSQCQVEHDSDIQTPSLVGQPERGKKQDDIKALINTGAISGKLDKCLAKIVEKATLQIEAQLNLLNQILQRAVAFTVAMSIVETILICVLW